MPDRVCVHVKNGGEEDRIVTVEDLEALHLPRFPLLQSVLGPWEQRSIEVTSQASFPGRTLPAYGCIRVFARGQVPRTLTVGEGEIITLE